MIRSYIRNESVTSRNARTVVVAVQSSDMYRYCLVLSYDYDQVAAVRVHYFYSVLCEERNGECPYIKFAYRNRKYVINMFNH